MTEAARPLKVLLLGQDPDMFARSKDAPNDTRARHMGYVRELLRRRPGSEVRIAVHTSRGEGLVYDRPFGGMSVYGTNSRSRLTKPMGLARLLLRFRDEGWVPDVISCQTSYEEGIIALALRHPASRVQVQVHSDFYGDSFKAGGKLSRIKSAMTRFAVRRCDHVRAVSHGIARSIVSAGDIAAERLSVSPVPVAFTALPRRIDPARPTILFVGRLSPEKNLGLWCAVAEEILRFSPNAHFIIAGDGPLRDEVARVAGPLGDRVSLPGAVGYDRLASLYAQADVFLFTSLFEGLGRVIVEAMLAGVPVVSADIIGPRDLIENGRTGFLLPHDAQAMARACLDLIEDPGLSAKIGRDANAWALENFGFEAITRRLVASWEDAAAAQRRFA